MGIECRRCRLAGRCVPGDWSAAKWHELLQLPRAPLTAGVGAGDALQFPCDVARSWPGTVGDIGFPMVVHPRDADTAWVFPMDGTNVWPRTSPEGRPAAYVTRNAGKTWQRLDQGLPSSQRLRVFRVCQSGAPKGARSRRKAQP